MPLQLGDITIDRIVELEGKLLPMLDAFPTLTPALLDENRPWLEPAGGLDAAGNLCVCVQSFLIRTPHHTVLIDSCVGNDKPRPRPEWNMKTDDRWMRGLASAGLGVEQIDYVMCTHMHVDHVGWNTRLQDGRWVPTFPNARYVFAQTEWDHWQREHAKEPNPVIADSVLPIVEAGRADFVASDHQLGDHLRFLPTPGHTPGHVSVLLGATGREGVVSGDLIHSPLQARYPELAIRFDTDMAAATTTRRAFLERVCDTGTVCCMTHFPSPSIGRITRWGDGFRCDPLP